MLICEGFYSVVCRKSSKLLQCPSNKLGIAGERHRGEKCPPVNREFFLSSSHLISTKAKFGEFLIEMM